MTIVLTRVKSLFVFVFHQVVGTWGIAFIAAFGLFSLFDMVPDSPGWKPSVQFAPRLLTENPYYPIQVVSGLYFGWLLGRRFQHRSVLWIWVLPLLILALLLLSRLSEVPWYRYSSRTGLPGKNKNRWSR